MIRFQDHLEGIQPDMLAGFFAGWPHPPATQAHLRILAGSQVRILAIDDQVGRVVGFITALSDGVLTAYIPLLEVLPEYQGQGIGTQLVRLMLDRLKDYYMVDLLCDDDLRVFYTRLGFRPLGGMALRNYAVQSGRS